MNVVVNILQRSMFLAELFLFYTWEVLRSNLRVAYDVVTPKLGIHPGILAVTVDLRKDISLTVLANLITMTPGSLSLDISTDRRTLYVHVLYLHDPEQVSRQIRNEFERRVKRSLE